VLELLVSTNAGVLILITLFFSKKPHTLNKIVLIGVGKQQEKYIGKVDRFTVEKKKILLR
jgi:hypothetical protein